MRLSRLSLSLSREKTQYFHCNTTSKVFNIILLINAHANPSVNVFIVIQAHDYDQRDRNQARSEVRNLTNSNVAVVSTCCINVTLHI